MALDGKPESHSSFVLLFRLFTHVSLLRFYRKWGLTLGLVCVVCGIQVGEGTHVWRKRL